ncbi:MAG: capsule assembly Wzi family protein, partial [Muribaculaceae bacterium]|nr:capsule assembly Wzi family protein [Muribaculaceae bacterium]
IYHYGIEFNTAFAKGAHNPFWLVNNRFGLSSIKKANGYMRAGFFRKDRHDKQFDYSFGADIAAAAGYTSTFIIQQLYADIRYRCINLTVGSRETDSQMVDPELSSGDLLMSRNARPIPQVRAAIDRYTIVPWTNQWLAVRGYFSMGAFTDGNFHKNFTKGQKRYNKHVLFHSKGGFLRIGNRDKFPLTVEGGLEMAAQWGGSIIYPDGHTTDLPHSFKDALKIIIPSGSNSSNPELVGEATNVLGNHTGQWCVAVDWHDNTRLWGARAYFEHFFEDHSMMFFDFKWRDMLLGLEIDLPDNRFASAIVYEYLYTKDQAGPVYWDHTPDIPEQVSGRDNYYNHSLYSGWEHWGMGLGNPLVISPIYNTDGSLMFKNNRIVAHHIGWKGSP